ncbi:MAG: aminotransferase class V-fold PLP-dependent enzyme [Verrucomicrobiae bacterium]|nr:aminotransferase class V-fold PLP-dependent enzyme [Verrucomicrobiae bacterium]
MYFDANATTPLCEAARETWLRVSARHWHNASGLYREAGAAKRILEEARDQLAELLGTEPERLVFTSGATEANHGIITHHLKASGPGRELVLSPVEHPSVREPALHCGSPLTEMPLDANGIPDPGWLELHLSASPPVALVSVMAANNETGILHPWEALQAICRSRGVPFHCDAAQWIGKENPSGLGACDFVTGCGHKFGGPKGVGFLLLPEDSRGFTLSRGGPQESRRRAGTEDVPGIAAMVAALEHRLRLPVSESAPRDAFEATLLGALPGTRTIGASAPRLDNTSMILLPRHSNLRWLTRLSQRGFALSTGSACSAGKGTPSHVMAAHGLSPEEMGRVLRASALPEATSADWQALAEAICEVAAELDAGHRHTGTSLPA